MGIVPPGGAFEVWTSMIQVLLYHAVYAAVSVTVFCKGLVIDTRILTKLGVFATMIVYSIFLS